MTADQTADAGRAAHLAWEASRAGENECDAERRLRGEHQAPEWWQGWLERSDEWRDEIGHDTAPA